LLALKHTRTTIPPEDSVRCKETCSVRKPKSCVNSFIDNRVTRVRCRVPLVVNRGEDNRKAFRKRAGVRCRKKRMLPCNEADRDSRFVPPRKRADVQRDTESKLTLYFGQVFLCKRDGRIFVNSGKLWNSSQDRVGARKRGEVKYEYNKFIQR
jgi:hypothetical protein